MFLSDSGDVNEYAVLTTTVDLDAAAALTRDVQQLVRTLDVGSPQTMKRAGLPTGRGRDLSGSVPTKASDGRSEPASVGGRHGLQADFQPFTGNEKVDVQRQERHLRAP